MPNAETTAAKSTNDVEKNTSVSGRRIDSMSDEQIIQENLNELLSRKSREERKANGRLIAVIVAFLVIFVAIYHVWTQRPSRLFAGILMPAAIMISYASWVVMLAKRDKQKKSIFDKHIEEVVLRNKAELEAKAKLMKAKKMERRAAASLHFENELPNARTTSTALAKGCDGSRQLHIEPRKHQKHHHRQRLGGACSSVVAGGSDCPSGSSSNSSSSTRKSSSHHATKHLRVKRPSIRQKLFRQHATGNLVAQVQSEVSRPAAPGLASLSVAETLLKRKRLQRMDALTAMPQLVRMSSAP